MSSQSTWFVWVEDDERGRQFRYEVVVDDFDNDATIATREELQYANGGDGSCAEDDASAVWVHFTGDERSEEVACQRAMDAAMGQYQGPFTKAMADVSGRVACWPASHKGYADLWVSCRQSAVRQPR